MLGQLPNLTALDLCGKKVTAAMLTVAAKQPFASRLTCFSYCGRLTNNDSRPTPPPRRPAVALPPADAPPPRRRRLGDVAAKVSDTLPLLLKASQLVELRLNLGYSDSLIEHDLRSLARCVPRVPRGAEPTELPCAHARPPLPLASLPCGQRLERGPWWRGRRTAAHQARPVWLQLCDFLADPGLHQPPLPRARGAHAVWRRHRRREWRAARGVHEAPVARAAPPPASPTPPHPSPPTPPPLA